MKTYTAKPQNVQHEWYVIDAQNKVLGRLASQIALRLRGKHKPEYTPHVDTGDFIVVVNASGLRVTGNKALAKKYYRHSGYPGGIYETNFAKMQAQFPERVLEKAVERMLPKESPLARKQMTHLRIYNGATHPHEAQAPEVIDFKGMNAKNVRSA